MKCGQIVLVNYSFTDHSGSKVRPALVVSNDSFNSRGDFTVVPISAQESPKDDYVFQLNSAEPYFSTTLLKPASRCVRWSKLMTISKSVVHSLLGIMPEPQLGQIRKAIRSMFE